MLDDTRTGDIVLFSGTCNVGTLIKFLQGSIWSHVGMVICHPDYDFPCLYESSHSDGLICLEQGVKVDGPQLVPLEEKILTYPGKVGYRRLINVEDSELDLVALESFRRDMLGRDFEQSIIQMFMANLPIISNKQDLSSLFCSELIAAAYQEMLLLPPYTDRPSNHYTPADFSKSCFRLLKGSLSEPFVIKE